jgi:hypothetical protein
MYWHTKLYRDMKYQEEHLKATQKRNLINNNNNYPFYFNLKLKLILT